MQGKRRMERGLKMEVNASEAEAETIINAANALSGHHSIVLVVRKEADRLNDLGYTATAARLFEAAKKLDALFVAIGWESDSIPG